MRWHMSIKTYIGDELELFSQAMNWKRYCGNRITPRLGARVLEVGAGLGETTNWLCRGTHTAWLCLEPDAAFCEVIQSKIRAAQLPAGCTVHNGTIESLASHKREFDSIIYIDVLEHVEDDRSELKRAAQLLRERGELIILSPAHDFLFSRFDQQIGHYRRYNRKKIRRICPGGLSLVHLEYLDCVGMLASLANRWLLGQSIPTLRQIAFWDKVMVRASALCDPLFGYRLGKSILAVMRLEKPGNNRA